MNRILWGEWGNRLHARLNQVGGLITITTSVVGILVSILSLVVDKEYAILLLIGGLAVCIPCVLYLFYVVWSCYPRSLSREELRDRVHTLKELKRMPGPHVRVALFGAEQTGKSTLRELLCNRSPTKIHTISREMVVVEEEAPVYHLVYLDSAGESLKQQFDITDEADIVVILLDHNPSPIDQGVRSERKTTQAYGVVQLCHRLRERATEGNPIQGIYLLRNKHDLWSNCPRPVHLDKLLVWFQEQLATLTHALPGVNISNDDHSNERTSDIIRARERILGFARQVAIRKAQKR